jgi:TolA-binding protein
MIYRSLMEEYPEAENILDFYFLLSEIFEKEGDVDRAAKVLISLSSKYQQNKISCKAWFEAAKKLRFIKKYKEAIECLETLIKEYPYSQEAENALFALGYYYKEINNDQKAIEKWEIYLQRYPNGEYSEIIKTQMKKERK